MVVSSYGPTRQLQSRLNLVVVNSRLVIDSLLNYVKVRYVHRVPFNRQLSKTSMAESAQGIPKGNPHNLPSKSSFYQGGPAIPQQIPITVLSLCFRLQGTGFWWGASEFNESAESQKMEGQKAMMPTVLPLIQWRCFHRCQRRGPGVQPPQQMV